MLVSPWRHFNLTGMETIALEEVYTFGHDGLIIYGNSTLIPRQSFSARFIFTDGNGILMWPVLDNDEVVVESICLSEIRDQISVTGLFPIDLGSIGSFLVVAFSHVETNSFGMILYKINSLTNQDESVSLSQVFPTKYRVMDARKLSNSPTENYLLVLGSDGRLHGYYLDNHGILHRSRSRSAFCRQWGQRLGLLQPEGEFGLPLRMLLESSKFHSEAIVAFSSGVVCWDRIILSLRNPADWLKEIPTPLSPISSLKSPPRVPMHIRKNRSEGSIYFESMHLAGSPRTPPPLSLKKDRPGATSVDGIACLMAEERKTLYPSSPGMTMGTTAIHLPTRRNQTVNLNTSVLLDGAVSCLCFYRRHSENYLHLHAYSAPYVLSSERMHLLVGLASGAAAIVSLDTVDNTVKPLPGSYEHGSVQAITVGDVRGNGYNDIIIGFYDGTVIICSPARTAHGHGSHSNSSSHPNQARPYHHPQSAFSSSSHPQSQSNHSSSNSNIPATSSLFVVSWISRMPFPVVGLAYGQLVAHRQQQQQQQEDQIQGLQVPAVVSTSTSWASESSPEPATSEAELDRDDDQNIGRTLPDQLAVITASSLHLFLSRTLRSNNHTSAPHDKCAGVENLVSKLAELVKK